MRSHGFLRHAAGVPATALILATLFTASPAEERLPWQDTGYQSATRTDAGDTYSPGATYGSDRRTPRNYEVAQDAYSPDQDYGREPYDNGSYGDNDAYRPNDGRRPDDSYRPDDAYKSDDSYRPSRRDAPPSDYGYGESYYPAEPGEPYERDYGAPADPPYRGAPGAYEQSEIISAGHRFFGSISQGLGRAVEYAFSKQGRPNGYVLGEDAGGAFIVGLRYGEGTLYTKDAGDHKVYWQGPSLGYDAGAEGSKTMVLVYNLRDPGEIYRRFGGVQGSVYVVGGVGVQFQKYGDVTLAVIRSGVGLRLGANVGYLKYTRGPTWNPL